MEENPYQIESLCMIFEKEIIHRLSVVRTKKKIKWSKESEFVDRSRKHCCSND